MPVYEAGSAVHSPLASSSTEVPRSQRDEVATGTAERRDLGDDVNITEENYRHYQLTADDDVLNTVDFDDSRDVLTIRRLRRLRKQLSSEVTIQRKWQPLSLRACKRLLHHIGYTKAVGYYTDLEADNGDPSGLKQTTI